MNRIYLPSKGRPQCPTAELLKADDIEHTIVVEPQDYAAYRAFDHYRDLLLLPKDDQGLAFARNFILDYHRENEEWGSWLWMLDDDITCFYSRFEQKLRACRAIDALSEVENYVHPQTGQLALEYQQLAWRATKKYAMNGYCDVAVCINTAMPSKIRYVSDLNLKEDRDFTLQVLMAGYRTHRITTFAFAAPKNGSNTGGLKSLYDQKGKERSVVDAMVNRWGPDICRPIVKKDGREDVRINWRFIQKLRTLNP